MKRLIIISTFIIIAGISVLFLALKTPEAIPGCGVKDTQFICGNSNFSSETATEGKKIFNTNCAACDKLDRNMTGPALRGIAQKYDSINLVNYIRGLKHDIKPKDYGSNCVNFPQLTDEDISNLLSYTN